MVVLDWTELGHVSGSAGLGRVGTRQWWRWTGQSWDTSVVTLGWTELGHVSGDAGLDRAWTRQWWRWTGQSWTRQW